MQEMIINETTLEDETSPKKKAPDKLPDFEEVIGKYLRD